MNPNDSRWWIFSPRRGGAVFSLGAHCGYRGGGGGGGGRWHKDIIRRGCVVFSPRAHNGFRGGGEDNTESLGRTIEVNLELSCKPEKTSESGVAVDPDPAVDLGGPGHSDSSSADTSATEKLLPAHLQSMFEDAKKHLTAEQVELVRQALIEFADVFAINDLDIGKFTALVQYIRTGQALPIKQSMRSTSQLPACHASGASWTFLEKCDSLSRRHQCARWNVPGNTG